MTLKPANNGELKRTKSKASTRVKDIVSFTFGAFLSRFDLLR